MAYLTDEERDLRIKLVYEYFKETGKSTREIADYFTKRKMKMSHVTVSSYLEKAQKIYKDDTIDEKKRENRGDLSSKKVQERVKKAADLFMEGYLISEISEILEEDESKIYRDLTERLSELNLEKAKKIKQKMEEHRFSNLKNNKKSVNN